MFCPLLVLAINGCRGQDLVRHFLYHLPCIRHIRFRCVSRADGKAQEVLTLDLRRCYMDTSAVVDQFVQLPIGLVVSLVLEK